MPQKRNFKTNQKNKSLRQYLNYSALGLQIVAIIGGGAFLGSWLDKKYPSDINWFTLALVLISVALSMAYVVNKINK